MPRVDGRMYICDRCGEEVFVANAPGVNAYSSETPNGWSNYNTRLLCRKCTYTLDHLHEKFMNGTLMEDD